MRTPHTVVQDHYAAAARGDLPGMVADFAPDITWTEMAGSPYAGTFVGPDRVGAEVFARIAREWEDFRAEPESYVSQGAQVVVFGRYLGTHRASGAPLEARFVHHWRVRDGVVVGFEQFTDTHLWRRAMG